MDTTTVSIQKAFDWMELENGEGVLKPEEHCPTRDIFQTRLDRMFREMENSPQLYQKVALLTAVTGELGNNSFDHNLGKWPDVPGVFFGYDINKRHIVLADCGLGVLETLRHVRPTLANHVEAVQVAFNEIISGRAPEKRGNGLKFVRKVVIANPIDLFFASGDAEVRIKAPVKTFNLTRGQEVLRGCFAIIQF